MAVSIGNISLKLTASAAGFMAGLAQAEKRVQSFAANTTASLSRINPLTAVAGVVGTIGAGFGIGKAISLAAEAEQAQVAFETMVGSALRAAQLLRDIRALAAETPFSTSELQQAARVLLGYGITADSVLQKLRMLGDVSAGTGKNIGELSIIFGQIQSTGRLMGQDALQLTQAGIPIYEELGKMMGKTGLEMRKMGEAGLISAEQIGEVFKKLTSEGGRFFQMTERQSRTLSGLWGILNDSLTETMRQIGQTLVKDLNLKELVNAFINIAEAVRGPVVTAIKELIDISKVLFVEIGKGIYETIRALGIFFANTQRHAQAIRAFERLEGVFARLFAAITRAQAVQRQGPSPLTIFQQKPLLSDATAGTVTDRILKDPLRGGGALSTFEDTSKRAGILFGLFRTGALNADQLKVALKDLDNQLKKTFTQDAASLAKNLASPLERFKAELIDLDELLKRNFINQELYGRAVKATFDKLSDTIKLSTDSPGAALAGSQEAQAARTRSLNRSFNEARQKDPALAIEALRKQQEQDNNDIKNLLRDLAKIRPKLVDIK